MRFSLLLALVAAIHTSVVASDTHADKATFEQHRNGSQTEASYARNARELRKFLWQHWLRRERGEAKVKWSTVEGDAGTSIYSVAPDDSGAWRVAVHLEGSGRPMALGET